MKNEVPEEFWVVSLREVSTEELSDLLDFLKKDLEIKVLQLPESGLDLIKMRDSVLGEAFYLGELSVSQCQVEVHSLIGDETQVGFCKIMEDSPQLAESFAIFDALLRMEISFPILDEFLVCGYKIWQEKQEKRKEILARTKVDFSLL